MLGKIIVCENLAKDTAVCYTETIKIYKVVRKMQDTGRQFHIHCVEGDVGRYCLLPGDPGRCEAIANLFDNPRRIGMNRE